MLTPKGKLYGDLTVACISGTEFLVFGSGAAQEMHRRWFESHMQGHEVSYENMSGRIHGIAISGPKSCELLQRICRDDVSSNAFKFRDVRQLFVGDVPAILVHLSFSGETGYEIYVAPEYLIKLYEALIEAGTDLALTPYGAKALMSLRLEKSWGVWTLDFRPDYTPAESGLDVFIQWDKEFIGKQAATEERTHGPAKKLVTLIIDTQNIDVSGDEAILKEGECVGFVSSGGYAHHCGKSVALGYVPTELAIDGQQFEVEICGIQYPGRLQIQPLLQKESRLR